MPAALLLLILCSGNGVAAQSGLVVVDQVAAVVENDVITLSDLQWFVRYRGLQVPGEPEAKRNFYLNMLEEVVDQKVISQEAEQTPIIQITSEDVEARINAYRNQFPSEEAFQDRLAQMEISMGDLRQLVRRQLAVNEFVEVRFKPFIIVMPNEIEEYYREEFVPQLEEQNLPAIDLQVVEESIRDILTERKTNAELERWLRSARRKADVRIMLYRDPPTAPNLPRALLGEQ
jgi:parvulin-like peptidyl-prolyl isomerase